ncbi:DUF3558 family protein [Amycolatopsis sp. NPDC088138]|uniref:DUF3558 family protein n=1 Tax=Amycolatopsis sp. NPDC088138 TaxID=3363938 RepID=UPI00382D77F7
MRVRVLALIAAGAAVAGCGPDPAPTAPAPAPTAPAATTSADPAPVPATSTGPPRPLREQDPCGLLSDQDERTMELGPGVPSSSVDGRACTYDLAVNRSVSVTIVENGGVSASGTYPDIRFIQPAHTLGRHQAGVTVEEPIALCVFSIAVGTKSRIDVTAVAAYGRTAQASATAYGVARVLEPKLP